MTDVSRRARMVFGAACACLLSLGVARAGTTYYLYDSSGNQVAVLDSGAGLNWCQNATNATTATSAQTALTCQSATTATTAASATTATALAANGANCPVGQAPAGVDAGGNAEGCFNPSGMASLPPGAIVPFAGSAAPSGYLLCNGQAVSRTAYAGLFGAIGTKYGIGDGSTTFNVPDLRGEFLRGLDSGRGVDAGRTLGSVQPDAIQGHRHSPLSPNTSFYGQSNANTVGLVGGSYLADRWTSTTGDPTTNGTHGTPRTASETRPRNIAVNFIIAY